MSAYQELDPELAWKLIEGYSDDLSAEAKALDAFYRQFRCPRCRGQLGKEFDGRHTFADPEVLTPRALLRCPTCHYLIDPHSNVVLDTGNPAKVPVDVIPIIGQGR